MANPLYGQNKADDKVDLVQKGKLLGVRTVNDTTTLTSADCGKLIMIGTAAKTITLPAVKAGCNFKFIATDTTADSSITTSEGTALLKGGAEAGDAYLTLAGTTIIVEAAASVGDHLELICDGTYWYVSGHSAHDAGFSVS